MKTLFLTLVIFTASCSTATRAPGVGGSGGGGNIGGGPATVLDGGTPTSDASTQAATVCIDVPAESTANEISVTSSGLFITF
ncbi:MAG: hypothetical protein IPJ88_10115 [Myxococcales bacterium]|nr:MAG: hypothetical protein IPJ88_10115 [Myxococcales bacterium]